MIPSHSTVKINEVKIIFKVHIVLIGLSEIVFGTLQKVLLKVNLPPEAVKQVEEEELLW